MQKRGPYRTVTRVSKSGTTGHTGWVVELECSHVLKLKRQPPRERMCCAVCAEEAKPIDDVLDMTDTYAAITLADKLGLDNEQVSVFGGAARVEFDAFQLKRFLS